MAFILTFPLIANHKHEAPILPIMFEKDLSIHSFPPEIWQAEEKKPSTFRNNTLSMSVHKVNGSAFRSFRCHILLENGSLEDLCCQDEVTMLRR